MKYGVNILKITAEQLQQVAQQVGYSASFVAAWLVANYGKAALRNLKSIGGAQLSYKKHGASPIYLDPGTRQKLAELAEEAGVSQPFLMDYLVRNYLKEALEALAPAPIQD